MEGLKRAKRRFWIAIAVTIALAAGIAGTSRCIIALPSTSHVGLDLHGGSFQVVRYPSEFSALSIEPCKPTTEWFHFDWEWTTLVPKFVHVIHQDLIPCDWYLQLPLWPLLLPSAIIAFRAHRTIRRLSRGVCKNCAYSRAGLAADAPCPECGRVPTA